MDFKLDSGWRCVIGGVCVHLVLGSLYCWGNITMGKNFNNIYIYLFLEVIFESIFEIIYLI